MCGIININWTNIFVIKKVCNLCGNFDYIFSKGACKFCASKNYKSPSTKLKNLKKINGFR